MERRGNGIADDRTPLLGSVPERAAPRKRPAAQQHGFVYALLVLTIGLALGLLWPTSTRLQQPYRTISSILGW
jgi:hypothetical protein